MKARNIFGIILLLTTVSCDQKAKQPPQAATKKPASFSSTIFDDFTPTAEGGAYAESFDLGLYYFKGPEAVRVKFPVTKTNQETQLFSEITPLAKGGAIVQSYDSKLWFLVADRATLIREVPALSGTTEANEDSSFALYINERNKRLEAERKLEERPDPKNY